MSATVDLSRPVRGGHDILDFYLIYFLIFCVVWVMERRGRRRKTKNWVRIAPRRTSSGSVVDERQMAVSTPTPPSAPASAPLRLLQIFGDEVFEASVDIAAETYRSSEKPPLETVCRRPGDFSGTGVIALGHRQYRAL